MLQVRAPRLPPEALGNCPALDRDGGNRLSLLPQLGQLSLSPQPLLSHRHIRSPCEVAHPSDLLHRRTEVESYELQQFLIFHFGQHHVSRTAEEISGQLLL